MVLKKLKDALAKAEAFQGSTTAANASLALSIAAPIVKGVGMSVPGVGILGGAMGLCADALDPSTQLSHLKEESKKLRKVLEESGEVAREHLENAIKGVEERIVTENKIQLEESIRYMSDDLKDIDRQLEPIKNLSRETYGLVVDLRYRKLLHPPYLNRVAILMI